MNARIYRDLRLRRMPRLRRSRRTFFLVVRYRVLISGQVQGVYFRDTCRRMATV